MDLGLEGKIAAVAGASRGLGRAIAQSLAAEGCVVSMCGRDGDALESAADRICQATGSDVFSSVADLSQAGGPERFIAETVERAGGLDILVTNTGGPAPGAFEDFDDQAWLTTAEAVLMPVVRLIRAALPALRARGGGRIVNVTSLSAKQPIEGLLLSNVYRPAIVGLAKTLSRELAADRILINNVCPGRISTDRLAQIDAASASASGQPIERVRTEMQQRIPLGRYGQPEEFAALVSFLVSRQASYITGTTIQCDGGLHAGLF